MVGAEVGQRLGAIILSMSHSELIIVGGIWIVVYAYCLWACSFVLVGVRCAGGKVGGHRYWL